MSNLRSFLKSIEAYDVNIEQILEEEGIDDGDSFKGVTEAQWDEISRKAKVMLNKEIKDHTAKRRLEKKLLKIEKHWRTVSGIKKTSQLPSQKSPKSKSSKSSKSGSASSSPKDLGDEVTSRAVIDEAISKGRELKKFMQANDCFEVELLVNLVGAGIECEDDITKISSEHQWDEIVRKTKVQRRKETTDIISFQRLEKTILKFEKLWRKKTGIVKTSQTGKKKEIKKRVDESSAAVSKEAIASGRDLKKWMLANGCFEVDLLVHLVEAGITCEDDIMNITSEYQWDEIVRKTKVQRRKDTTDIISFQRLEKVILKFEKLWRQKTGIIKTSQTGKQKEIKKRVDESSAAVAKDAISKGRDLKKWMLENGVFEVELLVNLVEAGVTCEEDIMNISSEHQWDEIVRKTKVQRRKETTDIISFQRLEKVLLKFEKLWRKKTGIVKTSQTKKTKTFDEEKASALTESSEDVKTLTKHALDLKKALQAEDCFELELFHALVKFGCRTEDDINLIDSEAKWDEIQRQCKVARRKDTTDTTSFQRLEKVLVKFEKKWRKMTGIKKTSIKSKSPTGSKKKRDKAPKEERVATLEGDGMAMKVWLRKNEVMDMTLWEELVKRNYLDPPDCFQEMSGEEFDDLIRVVRVARMANCKDQASRTRLDKKLKAFEKLFKQHSGL